jgi:hypothetical protein
MATRTVMSVGLPAVVARFLQAEGLEVNPQATRFGLNTEVVA